MAKKKSTGAPVPYDDSEWRARADAQTLMDAYKIQKDAARRKKAKAAAKKLATEAQATVDAAKTV